MRHYSTVYLCHKGVCCAPPIYTSLVFGLVCFHTLLIWSSRFETNRMFHKRFWKAWVTMNAERAPKTKGLWQQITQPRGFVTTDIGCDQIQKLCHRKIMSSVLIETARDCNWTASLLLKVPYPKKAFFNMKVRSKLLKYLLLYYCHSFSHHKMASQLYKVISILADTESPIVSKL